MKHESQDGSRVYQGVSEVCADCPLQSRCCQSAKGKPHTFTTDDKEPLRQQMNVKMEQRHQKNIYIKRKSLFNRCLVKKKANFVVSACAGKKNLPVSFQWSVRHTILKKICQSIVTGLFRPAFENLTITPAI